MFSVRKNDGGKGGRLGWGRIAWRAALALCLASQAAPARPARLVIALDGVAYRDMLALQAGVTRTNFWGKTFQLRAFTAAEGYFPVSRMISTFPSASDVAWTDIFGDRPLPGYQRTYFSAAANSLISINGVTTTMEHERQMDWQVEDGFIRAMGYLGPAQVFDYEVRGTVDRVWNGAGSRRDFYVYLRASDDAQHLDRDIFALLCQLDAQLQKLRARYQAVERRDLEIVILSDHGHNHAGRGIRVRDAEFLEQAGYHVGESLSGPRDVVLPVVGIESWIELHCLPAETEKLGQLMRRMEGVDVLSGPVAGRTNCFFVMDSRGARADIEWHPAQNSFRYVAVSGDPLNYQPVVSALAQNGKLDAGGFAAADDWMAATVAHHYPLALERIARGLTRGALNPATLLISLDNRYVNARWLTEKGSRLVTCGSTHGGLDDICSDGIVLCNFQPTKDTSTARVAGQFQDFADMKDFRAAENGAELVTKGEQSLVRIPRVPFDREYQILPDDGVYLRVWSPELKGQSRQSPMEVTVKKVQRYSTAPGPMEITLNQPVTIPDESPDERVYAFPGELKLEPLTEYDLSGRIQDGEKRVRLFDFSFHTTRDGQPAAY